MEIKPEELLKSGNLELLSRQVVEGFITGLHKSPFHGFSVEFAEHRQYNAGQSTRNIDWKLFARTEKLFVKRFEEETNLRCHIIIDTSSSMYFPSDGWDKLKFSVLASACIMQMLKKQRDAMGLIFFDENINMISEIKSNEGHYRTLITKLEQLIIKENLKKQSKIVDAIHEIAERIHRRSLVIIFTDFFDSNYAVDDIFSAIQHLKYNKHEVILFHTLDKKLESDFEFENRPYIFEDIETGEKIKISPNDIKEQYQLSKRNLLTEIKNKCSQYQIDFIEANVNEELNQILMPFIIRRQKMMV